MTHPMRHIERTPEQREDSQVLKGLWGLFFLLWLGRMGIASVGFGIKGQTDGILFLSLGTGLIAFFANGKWRSYSLILTTILWGVLLWGKWIIGGMPFPYLPEHGISVGIPLAIAIWLQSPQSAYKFLRVLLAMTFLGHGLYALGWPEPQPPHFIWMTTELLGISQRAAGQFLLLAGVLDMLVVIGVFGSERIRRIALWYAMVWGILTAIARPLAYVEWETLSEDLWRWLPEMIIRLPHGGVALLLLLPTGNLPPDKK